MIAGCRDLAKVGGVGRIDGVFILLSTGAAALKRLIEPLYFDNLRWVFGLRRSRVARKMSCAGRVVNHESGWRTARR